MSEGATPMKARRVTTNIHMGQSNFDEHGAQRQSSKVHQSKVPNAVQEVSMEDEFSERDPEQSSLNGFDPNCQNGQMPRSSVQTLINMMTPGGNGSQGEQNTTQSPPVAKEL